MNPYEKAEANRNYDIALQYRDDLLSRKPSSTKTQREALKQRVAQRKANGTLNSFPFVIEAVTKPQAVKNQWQVEVTSSDGIIRRVSLKVFDTKDEAEAYAQEARVAV